MRSGGLIPRRARNDSPDAPPWPSLGPRAARIALPLAAIVALAVAAVIAASGSGLVARERPPALADLVPYDGRSPREPAAEELRVIVALPRPALGELERGRSAAGQRAYVESLEDEDAALRSALAA